MESFVLLWTPASSSPAFSQRAGGGLLVTVARTVIIELKFGPESAEDAALVTSTFPLRVARFSKYVAGMERM